jgi:DNA-binding protein H-NS
MTTATIARDQPRRSNIRSASAPTIHQCLFTAILQARRSRASKARSTIGVSLPDEGSNPSEAWAGRGLKPRWLTAAIKTGKKAEDFLIAGSTPSKANGRKKARKARK